MLKTLTIAAVAALTATAALAVPAPSTGNGKLIGDGTKLPREYVPNRDHNKRRGEIAQWILDKGGKFNRGCLNADRFCMEVWRVGLVGGGDIAITIFRFTDGKRKDFSTYCRANPSNDQTLCYKFENGTYRMQTKDIGTGKWETVWNEEDEQRESIKPSSDDLL